MKVFEKTLRDLFGRSALLSDTKFTGKTLLARLDRDLLVKMSFVEQGVANNYTAISVGIINRTEGVVDKQVFSFSDMVPARSKETTFGRNYPYIWVYDGKPDWCGQPLTPREQQLIRGAILDYVGMYLDMDMSMSEQSM